VSGDRLKHRRIALYGSTADCGSIDSITEGTHVDQRYRSSQAVSNRGAQLLRCAKSTEEVLCSRWDRDGERIPIAAD
jgi:hypothetical protein